MLMYTKLFIKCMAKMLCPLESARIDLKTMISISVTKNAPLNGYPAAMEEGELQKESWKMVKNGKILVNLYYIDFLCNKKNSKKLTKRILHRPNIIQYSLKNTSSTLYQEYLKLFQINRGDPMDIPVSNIQDIPKRYRKIS